MTAMAVEHEPSGALRDRKKRATRKSLHRFALELVAERGYANVTVEDIALAADVSPRTFFNYFTSKDAALVGEDPDYLASIHDAILARPNGEPPFIAVRNVILAKLAEHGALFADEESVETWRLRMSLIAEEPHLRAAFTLRLAEIDRSVAEAVAARCNASTATDAYPALVAAAASAALRVAFSSWTAAGGVGSPESLVSTAFAVFGNGLHDETITSVPVRLPVAKRANETLPHRKERA